MRLCALRRAAITEIVLTGQVSTQEEIRELLKGRFDTTQETVSRDLRALGAHKEFDGSTGRYRYTIKATEDTGE